MLIIAAVMLLLADSKLYLLFTSDEFKNFDHVGKDIVIVEGFSEILCALYILFK